MLGLCHETMSGSKIVALEEQRFAGPITQLVTVSFCRVLMTCQLPLPDYMSHLISSIHLRFSYIVEPPTCRGGTKP
jgi:hypothetical protein